MILAGGGGNFCRSRLFRPKQGTFRFEPALLKVAGGAADYAGTTLLGRARLFGKLLRPRPRNLVTKQAQPSGQTRRPKLSSRAPLNARVFAAG